MPPCITCALQDRGSWKRPFDFPILARLAWAVLAGATTRGEVGGSRRRRIRERPKSNGRAANECRLTTSLRSMLHGKQDSPGVCWSQRARDLGLPVALPGAEIGRAH